MSASMKGDIAELLISLEVFSPVQLMVYPVTQVRLSPKQFASVRWLIRLKKLSLAMEPSFLSLCKTW